MVWETVTVIGLFNYDEDLFKEMQLPPQVEPDVLIPNLLAELGNLEVVYPDPVFMRNAIQWWSKARLESWKRSAAAFLSDYNPIHNFDRNEEWSENGSDSRTTSKGGTGTDTSENQMTGTGSTNGTSSNEHKTIPYNGNELMLDNSDSGTSNNTSSSTGTANGKTDRKYSETGSDSGQSSQKHNGHLFGNIGVTKTQEMISDELRLRLQDVYHMIIQDFKVRFCIMVY